MAFGGFDAGLTSVGSGTRRHPAVITEAAESFEAQHRARVRRYTIIMAFRIPALVLAAIAYSSFGSPWIAIAIIAVSIPLPWIAVLIANDRPPKKRGEVRRYAELPNVYPALEPRRDDIEPHHPTIDG